MCGLFSDKYEILRKNDLIELLKEKDETMIFSHIDIQNPTLHNYYRAEGENFELIAGTYGILRNLFCKDDNPIIGQVQILLKPSLDEVEKIIGLDETDKFISEHILNKVYDRNPRIYHYSILDKEIRLGKNYDTHYKNFYIKGLMGSLDWIIELNVELKEKMSLI